MVKAKPTHYALLLCSLRINCAQKCSYLLSTCRLWFLLSCLLFNSSVICASVIKSQLFVSITSELLHVTKANGPFSACLFFHRYLLSLHLLLLLATCHLASCIPQLIFLPLYWLLLHTFFKNSGSSSSLLFNVSVPEGSVLDLLFFISTAFLLISCSHPDENTIIVLKMSRLIFLF